MGLASAIFAQQSGLSPLVIESGVPDGDKACGEGLMPGVAPCWQSWELILRVTNWWGSAIARMANLSSIGLLIARVEGSEEQC